MNKIDQYQKVQVMTADKVRLIIMLYDGVIRFNKGAQRSIREGDVEARNTYLNKSLAIIGELQNSLNMEEGGEIAMNLSRLYDFSIDRLSTANLKNDSEAVESVTRVISELKSGWEGIASERAQPETSTQPRTGISCGI